MNKAIKYKAMIEAKMKLLSLQIVLCLLFANLGNCQQPVEAESKASSSTSKTLNTESSFIGVDMRQFYPGKKSQDGNAAKYYSSAFKKFVKATDKIDKSIRDNPQQLLELPDIIAALEELEQGALRLQCSFLKIQDTSSAELFTERPSSYAIQMLTYLLLQKAKQAEKNQQRKKAKQLADRAIIFSWHLFKTAETFTQAVMGLQNAGSVFVFKRNLLKQEGSTFEAHNHQIYADRFKTAAKKLVARGPKIRQGLRHNLMLVLADLDNEIPVVRLEALRALGDALNPNIKTSQIVDPQFDKFRKDVNTARDQINNMLSIIVSRDPDERVVLQAEKLIEFLKTVTDTTSNKDESTTPGKHIEKP